MFRVVRTDNIFARYRLCDGATGSEVEVIPERGALVTSFRVAGREALYLDASTLLDRARNVRGGIPVLFPIAGKLTGGQFVANGRRYSLAQHGFARSSAWSVVEVQTDRDARIVLSLSSSESTRAQFPWDFQVRLTFVLAGDTLTIEQHYENRSADPMPLHAGFHPYFRVPDVEKAHTTITTDATRAFDNTRGTTGLFDGFDLTLPEVDLHLLDPTHRCTLLTRPGGEGMSVSMDESFTTVVVWTLAGKDYVCVEPWTAPGDALNTGSHLLMVPPGGKHAARVAFTSNATPL